MADDNPLDTSDGVQFPVAAIRRLRGKKVGGLDITDEDLLASSVEARPELSDSVNTLMNQGFSATQILDQALENQSFFMSPELNPFEQGLGEALRSVGSQAFGILGDTMDFVDNIGKMPVRAIAKATEIEQLDPDRFADRERAQNIIPRSEDIKARYDELTDQQFSPIDEADQQIADNMDLLFSLALPSLASKAKGIEKGETLLKTTGRMVRGLVRPTVQVAGGEVAARTAEALGVSEENQERARMASIFLLGLRSPGSARKMASEQQGTVRARIPDARVSAKLLQDGLNDLKADLRKGTGEKLAQKKPIFKRIREIEAGVKRGEINMLDVEEFIKENNQIIEDPATLKGFEKRLKRVQQLLSQTFEQYADVDAQLVADFKQANATTGAVIESEKSLRRMAKWQGLEDLKDVSPATVAALQFRSGRPLRGLFTLGVNQAVAPFETFELMNATPSLQKFYVGALEAAAKNDVAAFIRNAKKLDKGLKKASAEPQSDL